MTNRILFVDDEALILNSLKRGLMDEDYECLYATSGSEALSILATTEVCVLVTDMKMPGMNGLDLLKEVKVLYPDIVKIVLSGYTQLPQVLVTVNQGDIFRFITKPWDLENEFKGVLREALDYYNYRVALKRGRDALEKKNVTFQNILKSYDDKILAVKEEVSLMRELNAMVFKEQNKRLNHWNEKTERREVLYEQFLQLETLVLEGFQLVPFSVKRFSTKSILEDIKRLAHEKRYIKRFDLGVDSKMPTTLKGKYELLLFLVMKLLDLYFLDSFNTLINIIISGEMIGEDDLQLQILLKSDAEYFVNEQIQESAAHLLQVFVLHEGGELFNKNIGKGHAIVLKMAFTV